ncbi:hypothetical protein NPN16_23840, partial [Vibrio parahaemolyticus]|nr:hypothetical protein [Vibrio parahaemolyticus]
MERNSAFHCKTLAMSLDSLEGLERLSTQLASTSTLDSQWSKNYYLLPYLRNNVPWCCCTSCNPPIVCVRVAPIR